MAIMLIKANKAPVPKPSEITKSRKEAQIIKLPTTFEKPGYLSCLRLTIFAFTDVLYKV